MRRHSGGSRRRGGGNGRRRKTNITINTNATMASSAKGPLTTLDRLDPMPEKAPSHPILNPPHADDAEDPLELDEKDCILSQDFFCTPDYITPDAQQICGNFEFDKEDSVCPNSPQKSTIARSKRQRQDGLPVDSICKGFPSDRQIQELKDVLTELDENVPMKQPTPAPQKKGSYVSQSAVALRCRVMPPPCIRNPFFDDATSMDLDLPSNRKVKSAGLAYPIIGGDGLSRYHTDFHEIEQIGYGSFSRVFKVLKRIDGCMYAVKCSLRPLHQDTDRRRALMEVQALAALGYHENIVAYHSSWFEDENLYIQMELCDRSLSAYRSQALPKDEILQAVYQIAKALKFIHERGVVHLDVKPDNIYIKNGVYKLGDFGFATLTNRTLPIEEGDSRYMPLEILNENYDHLDKVDIFSLGAMSYELVKGSPLPKSGTPFLNLREGKIALLPGYSMQFQNLLKAMMDPQPARRPSAKEVLENPTFNRICGTVNTK